jgi:hypothetical protein
MYKIEVKKLPEQHHGTVITISGYHEPLILLDEERISLQKQLNELYPETVEVSK